MVGSEQIEVDRISVVKLTEVMYSVFLLSRYACITLVWFGSGYLRLDIMHWHIFFIVIHQWHIHFTRNSVACLLGVYFLTNDLSIYLSKQVTRGSLGQAFDYHKITTVCEMENCPRVYVVICKNKR